MRKIICFIGILILIFLIQSISAYKTCTLNPAVELTTDDDYNSVELCNTNGDLNHCSIDNDDSGEEEYTYIQYNLLQCPFSVTEQNIIDSNLVFGMDDNDDTEYTDVAFVKEDLYCSEYDKHLFDLLNYGQGTTIISNLKDNPCCDTTSDNGLNCDCDITSFLQSNLVTGSTYDDENRISFQWHMDNGCRDDCDNALVMGWDPDLRTRKAELHITINEAPNINCNDQNITEDYKEDFLVNLKGCSSDDDTGLSYSIISQSNSNLINCHISGDSLVCNPPELNSNGYSDIKVMVIDKYGLSNEDEFRINVTPEDDPAIWEQLEDKEIEEDFISNIIYKDLKSKCSDIDSPIEIKIITESPNYNLSFLNNDLIIDLNENYYGNENIKLECNNISAAFKLNILPVNDAPVFLHIDDREIYENESINLDLNEYAFDIDNEELNFNVDNEFCSINESILFCSNFSEGLYNVSLIVNDSNLSAESNFGVNVLKIEEEIPENQTEENIPSENETQEDSQEESEEDESDREDSKSSSKREYKKEIKEVVDEEIPKIENKTQENIIEIIDLPELKPEKKSNWKYILYILFGILTIIVTWLIYYLIKYERSV